MTMEIRFGRPIVSKDGARAGIVAGLVLDTECRWVRQIVVLHGADERVVPFHTIVRVNEDGILDLNVTAFEVQQMTRSDSATSAGVGQSVVPYTSWVSGEGMAPTYTPSVPDNHPYHSPAASDPDVVEIDSEIVVTGPDGKVVGTIAGLAADENGSIQELVIGAGFLRPDIRVDMSSVTYSEGSYVSHLL
jgi:sporulation protein YlmC with PRC-barrel domain